MEASVHIMDATKFQMGECISKGAHSRIHRSKWEGLQVVVKEILIDATQQDVLAHFMREYKQVSNLRHPNLVSVLGVCFPHGVPSLVMEHLHCNLQQLLEINAAVPLSIKMRILCGIGLGLRYLHSHQPPFMHKQLSSTKILVSDSMAVKIAHLSTVHFIDNVGTSQASDFSAPEMFSGTKIGIEVDIFSFGCIMIHTLSQKWPTPSQSIKSCDRTLVYPEIERRSRYLNKVPKLVERVMIPLITSCLDNVPVDRPSAEEVCDKLETMVMERQSTLPDNFLQAQLRLQEVSLQVESQTTELDYVETELAKKTTELQLLSSELNVMELKKETPVNSYQDLSTYLQVILGSM